MSKTIAQERSKFALEKVEKLTCDRKKFSTLSKGLPAMVLQNGFGHTLAFLLAKGNDEHINTFDIVTDWLRKRTILPSGDRKDAIKKLAEIDQAQYLRAQEESLYLLEWVKRYSSADIF